LRATRWRRVDSDPEGYLRRTMYNLAALDGCAGYLRSGQLLVLRSTVYPGVTALVEKTIAGLGIELDVAFCPERIAEGRAMTELFELPQIVSARTGVA
jgi:UDP-N-acetyl-D-mannosaminuronic acid dehydrogenase